MEFKSPKVDLFNPTPRSPIKCPPPLKKQASRPSNASARPIPPTKPAGLFTPGGVPVMNELDSVLKKQRSKAAVPNQRPPRNQKPGNLKPKHPLPVSLSKVQQMNMNQLKSPVLANKPLPPQPKDIEPPNPVWRPAPAAPFQKPLMPAPEAEETYEAVNTGDSDDEDWTYEPLPSYNIYNI
ncbi:pollen-specific leucine-rich repeat extensin-like protein 1 [Hyposmocoma kahamanoa]|uniref:pollen-specific leucine-rich repeat extensin-like protein 1 n=1 Tax=Hyposmocoma kahamanoa TaxID=1477025 RepID=UPI000E6D60B8|nr:pollen-specific leucine-rich repeat extensin-like protein 1 [Hyposmocoma kahamanoa]